MKSLLLFHRSVGRNLIYDGGLYELITNTGMFTFSDYDQNTDILTSQEGRQQKMDFSFPGGNTRPQDFAVIFSDDIVEQYKPIQDEALRYDTVVIKSCYPNSNISSDEELEQIKHYYQGICDFFTRHGKKLVIMTSPPLMPLMTRRDKAERARQLTDWLANTDFGSNIKVFNLFDLLANPSDERQANMLKKEYRRWVPTDSHPNKLASKEIAPLFVDFLQVNMD